MAPSRCFTLGQGRATIVRVARPKWTPQTAEQRHAIAAAKRAAKRADDAEGLVWTAVAEALELDVPASYIADAVGRGRATLYRRIPRAATTVDTGAEHKDAVTDD